MSRHVYSRTSSLWSLVALVALSASAVGGILAGQEVLAETPPTCRICVVNVQQIIQTSKVGTAARKQFKTKLDKAQAEMQKRKSELAGMAKSLEKEVSLLSEGALKKKKIALRDKERALQDDMQELKSELAIGKQQALKSVLSDVKKTLASWGEDGFKGMVLESDPRFIVYASKSVDVSDLMKKSMDERYRP